MKFNEYALYLAIIGSLIIMCGGTLLLVFVIGMYDWLGNTFLILVGIFVVITIALYYILLKIDNKD